MLSNINHLFSECNATIYWNQTSSSSWRSGDLLFSNWLVVLQIGEIPLYAITFKLVLYGTNTLYSTDTRTIPVLQLPYHIRDFLTWLFRSLERQINLIYQSTSTEMEPFQPILLM